MEPNKFNIQLNPKTEIKFKEHFITHQEFDFENYIVEYNTIIIKERLAPLVYLLEGFIKFGFQLRIKHKNEKYK